MKPSQPIPFATLLVIAANIFAAFVLLFQPDLVNTYGFIATQPNFLAAFTCLFLHLNVLHLLGNMLFLAAVGPAVEIAAGTGRFISVYLLGGFAGVAAHFAMADRTLSTSLPLIGASGCVSACIGYYSLRYIHMRVSIAPKLHVPVLGVIGVWLALQVLGAFLNIGGAAPTTAYWAHLGGFAMGIILGLIFRAPVHSHKEAGLTRVRRMNLRSPGAKLAAAEIVLQHHPDDIHALTEKADALALLGEPDDEAETLIQLLDLVPEAQQSDLIIRLDGINRLEKLPSRRRSILAARYKGTSTEASRRLLLSVIRVMSDKERPDALYALATLDYEESPELARTWLEDLTRNYPLHPAAEQARTRGWVP